MKTFFYASFALFLCLNSCVDWGNPPNLPPALLSPQVTLSQDSVPVGDYVTVTVSGGYSLPSPNETSEVTMLDSRLGICFIPSDSLIKSSDTVCENLNLPDSLEVSNDTSLFTEHDVTLKKGETVEVSHSVRLRSSRAQGLTVVGYYGAPDGKGGIQVSVYGVQAERAFIKFD